MFKVTHGKVKHNGDIYGKNEKAGDIISSLSSEQEESLVKKGYGEIIKVSGNKASSKGDLIPDDYTVDDVKKLIEETNDIEKLYALLDFEEANKKRAGVIKPLEAKIVELEENEGDNDEDPGKVDINLDPDELIED